jgi:hypothetical protein
MGRCLLLKWLGEKLGEYPLGLVLPPGEVLCGVFAPSFSGRVDNSIRCSRKNKTTE